MATLEAPVNGNASAAQGKEDGEKRDLLLSKTPLHEDQFVMVMKLNMSKQKLASFPAVAFQHMPSLVELNLSENAITALTHALGQPISMVSAASTLKILDMSNNLLTSLPSCLCVLSALEELNLGNNLIVSIAKEIGQLVSLKSLNLMSNKLSGMLSPPEIGNLSNLLRLGLKGNQLTGLPSSIGGLTSLVELYLTNNNLTSIPAELGRCSKLRKLQLSYNDLQDLPAELSLLPNLELFRVAVNPRLAHVPSELCSMSSLSWVSLAGCKWCPHRPRHPGLEEIHISSLQFGAVLGSGASGEVFQGVWKGEEVAIKVFNNDASPDGRAVDEIEIACHVLHSNLVEVMAICMNEKEKEEEVSKNGTQSEGSSDVGSISSSSSSSSSDCGSCLPVPPSASLPPPPAPSSLPPTRTMVLKLFHGEPLALKPNFQSVLRCRYPAGQTFEGRWIRRVAMCVCSALAYMHDDCIAHGDLYAHNVLADEQGDAIVCDFGASFFYPAQGGYHFEAVEVRAFGLLLADLVQRQTRSSLTAGAGEEGVDEEVCLRCLAEKPGDRPSFREILEALKIA